jgi:hypothetical protein
MPMTAAAIAAQLGETHAGARAMIRRTVRTIGHAARASDSRPLIVWRGQRPAVAFRGPQDQRNHHLRPALVARGL